MKIHQMWLLSISNSATTPKSHIQLEYTYHTPTHKANTLSLTKRKSETTQNTRRRRKNNEVYKFYIEKSTNTYDSCFNSIIKKAFHFKNNFALLDGIKIEKYLAHNPIADLFLTNSNCGAFLEKGFTKALIS